MASDYVIIRFHHLLRLVLVHGRYSHIRTSLVALTSFYKNWLFPLPILWFGFSSGASGYAFYDSIFLSFFTLFSSAPPFVLGLFEKDLAPQSLLDYPQTYQVYRSTSALTGMKLLQWVSLGLWQALVLYYVAHFLDELVREDGAWKVGGLDVFGNLVVTGMVLVQNIQLSVQYHLTVATLIGSLLGVIGFFALFAVCSYATLGFDLYGVFACMFSTPSSWLYLLLSVVLCFLPSFTWKGTTLLLHPSNEQHVQAFFKQR